MGISGVVWLFIFIFLDLVVLVGTRMDDRLVGQAQLDVIFIFLHKSKTREVPGTRAPTVLARVRTRAVSVAIFGYIHEAEERSKIIFFSDSMQGVIKKNYFFSFSPLFCKPQLLLLIWAASM